MDRNRDRRPLADPGIRELKGARDHSTALAHQAAISRPARGGPQTSPRRQAMAPTALAIATGHRGAPAIPKSGPKEVYMNSGHQRALPRTKATDRCRIMTPLSRGPGRTVWEGYRVRGLPYVFHPEARRPQEQ